MSSYRGAWDGGPPGAEGEYAPRRLPPTDPWTGASYAHYAPAYGAYPAPYYPPEYYPVEYYQSAYPAAAPPARERSPEPRARRDPYPRSREDSYSRRRRERSSDRRHDYTSSDRSTSRSRSYTPVKDKKKRRTVSSDSSGSNRSYERRSGSRRRSDRSPTPPVGKRYRSRNRSDTPGTPRSGARSVSKGREVKGHSSKERKDRKRRDVVTPPRNRKASVSPEAKRSDRSSSSPPRGYRKSDRDRSITPPKSYKYKERKSDTPPRKVRESSVTPPKSYARNSSSSSKSGSESPERLRRRRRSSSRSSDSSRRSHSKRRKGKRKSPSKQRSRSGSSRSGSRRRSGSASDRRKRSASGTPSDDERRGQFTVTDRKRFWKMHRSRHAGDRVKTPPKELKVPPGAVEAAGADALEYGDPPDVEGPNFAELLPPPDLAALAAGSSSKSRAVPMPIKNDGSFLEMFKKMQEVTKKMEEDKKPEMKKPALPFIGKRRGGRVLKTGLVKKAKAIDEQPVDNTPKDAWSLYMQEVKKYRETSCEEERKTRPLVK